MIAATSGADELTAWSTLASAVIVAVAAAFAWWQLRVARRVRYEETRPYVILDVETRNDHLVWMVIHNSGLTPAYNLTFEFTPPLQSTMDASTAMRSRAEFMAQTWPILPPGKKIETIFDSTVELFNSELPTRYEAVARYTNARRRAFPEEAVTLDIGVYRGRAYTAVKSMTQLTEAIESIGTTLKNMTEDGAVVVLTKPLEDYEAERSSGAATGKEELASGRPELELDDDAFIGAGALKRISPIFPVRDLTVSLGHYGRLGFATREYREGGYGFATLDDIEIHLGVVPPDKEMTPASAYLFVKDAVGLAEIWASAGADVRTPEDTEWGQHEGVVIDPDGNIIRFGSPIRHSH